MLSDINMKHAKNLCCAHLGFLRLFLLLLVLFWSFWLWCLCFFGSRATTKPRMQSREKTWTKRYEIIRVTWIAYTRRHLSNSRSCGGKMIPAHCQKAQKLLLSCQLQCLGLVWPSKLCALTSSPPVRWGLLDFMSVSSSPPPSSPSPPSPPPRPLLLCRPPQLTGILCVQCGVLDPNGNWDPLSSVWRAGLQLQLASSQFSVACWTPTAILWVRCGVLDPNRDIASSVWRAGPQPRYCVWSVACWTPTAILRVQCGVLDPNRDIACWVWRAGPQKEWSKK